MRVKSFQLLDSPEISRIRISHVGFWLVDMNGNTSNISIITTKK